MPVSSVTEHWIKPDAVTINLNHFGDPDYLQVSVLAGAVVMAFKQDIIGYNAAHNYRTWPLQAANTYLETTSAYNVYARLTRSEMNASALIVYDPILRDIEGRPISLSEDGTEILGEADPAYFYVFLGQISESLDSNGNKKDREWLRIIQYGSLDSSEQKNNFGLQWEKLFKPHYDDPEDPKKLSWIEAKANMGIQGGVSMFIKGDNINIPTIAEGLPFDQKTIWFNPTTGQIEVIGGTGGSEGVSNFWDLSGIPSWITNTKPTYSYSEIQGTPDLSVYALKSAIPSLDGYATEAWVLGRGYALSSDLLALTTKVNDFLEGSDTDNIINKWKELEAFLAGLSQSDNLATILGNKANKATTLSGYGITDAYTKTKVNELLGNYVTLKDEQTIEGKKDFTDGGLFVNGSQIKYDKDKKYWKLEGDLLVTGGVSMYSSDTAFTPSTIMDAIAVDNVTIIKQDGKLVAIGGGGTGGGLADSVAWGNVLGKPSWRTDAVPTISISGESVALGGSLSQSELRTALGLGSNAYSSTEYLPLTGGTITGNLTMQQRIVMDKGVALQFKRDDAYTTERLLLPYSGFDYAFSVFDGTNWGKLWHSANDGSGSGLDADLLDGVHNGELTALYWNTTLASDMNAISRNGIYHWQSSTTNTPEGYGCGIQITNSASPNIESTSTWWNQLGFGTNGNMYFRQKINAIDWTDWKTIAFTDSNVASATKLQTARTIWGQSFDGSGNVSGHIYLGANAIFGYNNASVISSTETNLSVGYGQSTNGITLGLYGNEVNLYYGKTGVNRGFVLNSSGNVTIGSSDLASTSSKLYVAGTANFEGNTYIGKTSSALLGFLRTGFNYITTPTSGSLVFNMGGTTTSTTYSCLELYEKDVIMVRGGGNVGVGTGSPSSKLHVAGSILTTDRVYTPYVFLGKDNEGIYLNTSGIAWHNSSNSYTSNLATFTASSITLAQSTTVNGNILATGGVTTNDSVTINGIKLYKSQDGVLYLDGNLVVKGGVTMYGTDATSAPNILDSLPIASTSAKGIAQFSSSHFTVNDGVVSIIGSNVGLNQTELSSYLTTNTFVNSVAVSGSGNAVTSASISGNKLTLTKGASYLSTSGGKITGNGADFFEINRTDGEYSVINFKLNDVFVGRIGVRINNTPVYMDGTAYRTIWHEGNDGSGSGLDADLLDGLHVSDESKPFGGIPFIGTTGYMDVGSNLDFHYDNTTGSDYSVRLKCTGNHAVTVLLPSSGGTLALTTDNVASATKLQTSRTIWGQSFDGTGNVSGHIYLGANAIFGYNELSVLSSTATNLSIGYGQSTQGISLGLYGNEINMYYGNTGLNRGLILNSSGNVTIGSSDLASTSSKLYVDGYTQIKSASTPLRLVTTNTASYASFLDAYHSSLSSGQYYLMNFGLTASKNNSAWMGFYYSGSASTSNRISFGFTGNDNLFNIAASGNVGIGTTTPTYKLTVADTAAFEGGVYIGTTSSAWLGFKRGSANYITTPANGYLIFNMGGTTTSSTYSCLELYEKNVIMVRSGGNVGIGTANPDHKLYVAGRIKTLTSDVDGLIVKRHQSTGIASVRYLPNNQEVQGWRVGASSEYKMSFEYSSDSFSSTTTNMTLSNAGLLTLNGVMRVQRRSNTSSYLDITSDDIFVKYNGYDSDGYCGHIFYSNGVELFRIAGNTKVATFQGNVLTNGGVTMYSARKLKNITDERGLSLEELSVIKPTRFTWKDGRDDKVHIGGIADDVMKVLPEVIYKTGEDDTLTMDYGNAAFAIAASLIKPVVNHEERIRLLEEENKRLKEEVEQLKWNIA